LPCSTKTEKWHYKPCWWEDILGKSADICHSFPNPNFFFDNCHCHLREGHCKPYTYHHHHKAIVNLRYQIKGGWKTYLTAAWRIKKKL
jgi:hypothetical protein